MNRSVARFAGSCQLNGGNPGFAALTLGFILSACYAGSLNGFLLTPSTVYRPTVYCLLFAVYYYDGVTPKFHIRKE